MPNTKEVEQKIQEAAEARFPIDYDTMGAEQCASVRDKRHGFIAGAEYALSNPLEQSEKKEELTRYFIVSYAYGNKEGHGFGFTDFITSGSFLNQPLTIKQIMNKNPGFHTVVINSIMELNKSDYLDWNNKDTL